MQAGGEALQELRATLGAIRDPGTDADRTPEPGLGRLQALQQRLSDAGARTHVSRAMIKLSARDRAQLVVFAYQSGLVT
jgi:hypothetical protein